MTDGGAANEPVNILLVDDRPNNLLSLKALLQRPDYNIITAQSGPEALALVLRHDFAAILMDVAMPRMDGFETASIIKQRDQSKLIPILFVTASVYDMEHVFRGYTVGAVDYLRKPVDTHAVRAKVAVFVELYRQRKQLERQAAQLIDAELREQRHLRQQAEDALQQTDALYQLTFEEAPVGIGHATPEGQWTRANRRLAELLGHDRLSLIGQPIDAIGERNERAALVERLSRIRAGDPMYTGEHRLMTAHGAAIWAEVTLSGLRDADTGTVRQVIVVVEDVDERKQGELERARLVRELQEGIRTRDDFLSIAAHELKTPITPLRLQIASLLRALTERPERVIPHRELLRRIETVGRASQRLECLVDRLLDESRLSAGRLALEPEEVDLGALARDAVRRMSDDANRAGCEILIDAPREVIGRWDPLRIDQAISNLLENAIKYGAESPIEVRVLAKGGVAQVRVRDHGPGIPEEAHERIFERFERVAPLRHFGGFGLGLWIVRRLAEAHGGRARVFSQPGKGAEFCLELPQRPEAFESVGFASSGAGQESRI